jgi:hypothetical protein
LFYRRKRYIFVLSFKIEIKLYTDLKTENMETFNSNGCVATKSSTRIDSILQRMSILADERSKLLCGIGEKISMLHPLEPNPCDTPEIKSPRMPGRLSDIEEGLEMIKSDNNRLSVMLSTLSLIV